MDFADPKWLKALWALPLLALLFYAGTRMRQRELASFAGAQLRESLAPGASWRKNLLKTTLKLAGFTLLVLALARPQFGKQLVMVEREGIDLVIVLDTSLSMLAEDMKPNRLERAKHEIIDLIRGLQGDRVGIVAFAGDAFVLCPLTVDYDAALMFVQTADVDIVSKPGSDLTKAIETATGLFQEEAKADRAIILVTDGENHKGDPVNAAKMASKNGVRIYTIGIGNRSGELIPMRGTDGSVSGYKKDREGETVLTRLDEKTLRGVAAASDGKYLPATRDGIELKVLYKEIEGLQKGHIEGEFIERKQDRFGWFLLAAFVLLALEAIVTRRGDIRRGRGRLLHTGIASGFALLALGGLPDFAHAGKDIDRGKVKSGNQYYSAGEMEKALLLYQQSVLDSVELTPLTEGVFYNQGNAYYKMGQFEDALNRYNSSFSEDSLNVGHMLYNRGNTLMQLGKPEEAVESYVQSLQFAPNDEDARHNLEMALRLLEQQQQEQQQQQDQNQDNQDQENQDQNQDNQDQQNQDQQDQQQDGEQQDQDQQDQQQSPPDSTEMNSSENPDSTQQQMQGIKLSREDALRILKLLEEQEKELQKEKRKAAFQRVPKSGEDW